ncbi:type II secretion system protein [Candidatus Daviesbacteria bacterium]|nr:type II secretion system protein [Candidatus Daviesbacteria bacterium]
MRKSGFTLVELIIVIGITTLLGVILTNTLTQALRGQAKVKIINQVKENGQVVLEQLSNEIKQAEKVICVGRKDGSTQDDTIVTFKAGIYSRFRLSPPTGSANGYFERNNFTGDNIPDGSTMPDLCSAATTFGTSAYSITDSDSVNGVSIRFDLDNVGAQKPVFTRSSQSGYNDTITIRFRAFQAIKVGQTYETAVGADGVLITTTVQVRGAKQ